MFSLKSPVLSNKSIYHTFIIAFQTLPFFLAFFPLHLTLHFPAPISTFNAGVAESRVILFAFSAVPVPTITRLPSDRRDINLHMLHLRDALPLFQPSVSDLFELDLFN